MVSPPHPESAAWSLALRLEKDRSLLADPRTGRVRPSRRLCGALSCASGTLCRALRLLGEQGIIAKAGPGRSPWVLVSSLPVTPPAPVPPKPSRPEAIADELRERLVRGRFPLGLLPPGKFLQREFACHHGTLRAALGLLERLGVVQNQAGRYRLAPNAVGPVTAPPVWLTESTDYFAKLTQWERLAIAGLERALIDFGWGQLRLLVRERSEIKSVLLDRKAAGYVNLYREGRGSWWATLERAVIRQGVPSVLIDLSDYDRQQKHLRADRRLFWIKTENREAGKAVGAYLTGKGHRRLAFLSAYPFREPETYPQFRLWSCPLWARKRFLGLDGHLRANGSATLEAYDATGILGFAQVTDDRNSLLPAAVTRFRERMAADPRLDPEEVRQVFGILGHLLESAQDDDALDPWFEDILTGSGATAWVCSNDQLAFMALRFLKRKGKRVPEDVAVVGFDNTLEASRLGLTSFDLGMGEIGSLAVNLLANPRQVRLNRENTAYVSGRLIPRESG